MFVITIFQNEYKKDFGPYVTYAEDLNVKNLRSWVRIESAMILNREQVRYVLKVFRDYYDAIPEFRTMEDYLKEKRMGKKLFDAAIGGSLQDRFCKEYLYIEKFARNNQLKLYYSGGVID